MPKVTIVGAGNVGATAAHIIASKNLADVVLIDVAEGLPQGKALDMMHMRSVEKFTVSVSGTNDYADTAGSDIVVITAGVARKPGQTRIDLAQTNVNIIKQITPQIVRSCPDATYVIVANPVDILTYVFSKVSGIPQNRIIGSGTLLDTARLRARIAEYLSVSQKNVHAYVFGEHGETSFVPWSIAEVSTISLADYKELIKLDQGIMVDLDYDEIDNYMRSSGGKIIRRKGCTNYAIAVSVCGICECLQGGVNAVVTVSTMLSGEYGISDVCLSLPMLLGNGQVQGRITPRLTDEELEKLHHSADALKAVIAQIDLTMPETKA